MDDDLTVRHLAEIREVESTIARLESARDYVKTLTPTKLVNGIDEAVAALDHLIFRHGLEKDHIKEIEWRRGP